MQLDITVCSFLLQFKYQGDFKGAKIPGRDYGLISAAWVEGNRIQVHKFHFTFKETAGLMMKFAHKASQYCPDHLLLPSRKDHVLAHHSPRLSAIFEIREDQGEDRTKLATIYDIRVHITVFLHIWNTIGM